MGDKRFLPVLFVGAVVLVGIALLFLLQGLSRQPAANTNQPANTVLPGNKPKLTAIIGKVEGTVTVQHADGTTAEATTDMVVEAKDTITTAANSSAAMIIFGGVRTALDANTSVRLDVLAFDPTHPQKQDMRLALVSGRVWSRVLKLLDPESRYEIEYSGVVSGVRGTAFVVTARGPQYRLDVFDGRIGLTEKTTANVVAGFSLPLNMNGLAPDSQSLVEPTPDEIRNDPWIREQLAADAGFAVNNQPIRTLLGAADNPADLNRIGTEAGPYTMDQPGAVHSGFVRVEVESDVDVENIVAGSSWQLHAFAVMETPNGLQRQEVTTTATWQVRDPVLLAVSPSGRAEAAPATGADDRIVHVVARWNDGTHEHSGIISIRIRPTEAIPGA